LDRRQQILILVDHAKNPRYEGGLEYADVVMPGGSPECGGSVVVHLRGEGDRITALSFTGQGDTISMGATSMAMQLVHDENLTMDEVLELDYDAFVGRVGREAVGNRTRNATMGLSALKAAVRKYKKDLLRTSSPSAGTPVCKAG
jgi:nitrogen fixation NifU-like protein